MAAELLADAHWSNFLYRHTARHWHAKWIRYLPNGDIKEHFGAERIFHPLPTSDGEEGCEMKVIYHYGDERGTVDTGPHAGPWNITRAEHSATDGLLHPSQKVMITLLPVSGGPSVWCAKESVVGQGPCAAELFLHHGDELRMSAGVVHGADGAQL